MIEEQESLADNDLQDPKIAWDWEKSEVKRWCTGAINNEDDVNCGNTNLNEDFIVAVHSGNFNFINCKFTLKNFRDFNGIRTHGLCVR